jgi:transcription initiation factor IIE alpha subunit
MNTKLENLVLATLSFFEPMTFSQIILDFDSDLLKDFPNFDKEQLQDIINLLEKKKLIKRVTIDKERGWLRVHPKRSWWKRLFPL